VSGRPRLLHGAAEASTAVLEAFRPGPLGGTVIAEVSSSFVVPKTFYYLECSLRYYLAKLSLLAECLSHTPKMLVTCLMLIIASHPTLAFRLLECIQSARCVRASQLFPRR
jgi:hypothetical protein